MKYTMPIHLKDGFTSLVMKFNNSPIIISTDIDGAIAVVDVPDDNLSKFSSEQIEELENYLK